LNNLEKQLSNTQNDSSEIDELKNNLKKLTKEFKL